jgi:hypothetical protein
MRHVQRTRPDAMQVLVDTKPRFRAQYEKARDPRKRRDAAHLYQAWAKGPVVPNSVVVDLWSDKPFLGTFREPGEIVILQSGEARDWKRILELLDGFTKANLHGRERRIIVDECLDFTRQILTVSTLGTTRLLTPHELAANATSELTLALTRSRDCLDLYEKCFPESRSFTCETMPQT